MLPQWRNTEARFAAQGRVMRRVFLAALLACLAPHALAQESGAPPLVTGDWVGQVSWNEPIVSYSWAINPDGTFSSGRLGRGHDGGGAWSANGAQITLKYDNGFRYEGELGGSAYSGAAYHPNGRQQGTFAMWREMKERPNESPDE